MDEFIRLARKGAGWHSFMWQKPSTGETAQMVAYVVGLQDWQWAVGTGVFIDDVLASVAAVRLASKKRFMESNMGQEAPALVRLIFRFRLHLQEIET